MLRLLFAVALLNIVFWVYASQEMALSVSSVSFIVMFLLMNKEKTAQRVHSGV